VGEGHLPDLEHQLRIWQLALGARHRPQRSHSVRRRLEARASSKRFANDNDPVHGMGQGIIRGGMLVVYPPRALAKRPSKRPAQCS
jgi:hypothetical protein